MKGMTMGRVAAGIAGVAALGAAAMFLSGAFNPQFTDGGVDVRNTKCEELAQARQAVADELEQRKTAAQGSHAAERDQISDAYWAKNQQLEKQYHECISRALTADPCKQAFEEVGRLYEEIMADFAADKGFNEAKFNQREQAKKEYNDCVEGARKPEFYQEKETQCDAELAAGRTANQNDRQAKEAAAQQRYEAAQAQAQAAAQQKLAILDAIEKKCKEPGGASNVNIGALTTGGSGAQIQSTSPACTGAFSGNDPELQRQIADLENQLQKAKAAGLSDGLFGTVHIKESLDELKQKLKDSSRTCMKDADCGSTEPVCCSSSQVGRAFCENGICASEKTDCVAPEICAGKPAQCVAPSTGAKQQDGVYISRTIPERGPCAQQLQTLNLQQATPDSARYAVVGNIPGWLKIAAPGGALPAKVDVSYSCGTVQALGPGLYTAGGSITVYNASNELINTIPFNVQITVTPVAAMIDVINYSGKMIPVAQLRRFTGPECDKEEHWHAKSGSATALDGTVIPDPEECGYGKTSQVPVIQVPALELKGEVRGLEGLKMR
ncbi:MAG: hypothetical protein Q7S23_05825 [bacterium]|nr:hypothetical protein [bacterium]